jgi:hypothetical protein
LYKKSQHISWDYFSNENSSSFYIDGDLDKGISERNDGKRKFLWGLESRYFNDSFHLKVKEKLPQILEVYESIFTYDEELISLSPKFKWVPAMGTWVGHPHLKKKNKLCSMVVSNKTYTPQQVFRVNFAKNNSQELDLYGGLIKRIDFKEEALNDYMFSVAVENDTCDAYFTEKILDCFATGCVPVYKGTKKISNFFNGGGIIFLEDDRLPELTQDLYLSKKEDIAENLERVLSFNTIEDWMYQNYRYILK